MEKLPLVGIIFVNLFIIAVIGGLIWLMKIFDWPFILGFALSTLIFHVAYWAKHGEWFIDS